ncbi:MAG: serine/threonine protein kinase [Alphaproteobacteria bacterium]|jgi:hypothetical protein|nr:serine/threonine protein kinase [Alphaproteobacteria bacterium]
MPDSTAIEEPREDGSPVHGADAPSGMAPPAGSADGDVAVLKDCYEIQAHQPLPDLNSATANAFVAIDRREPRTELVGYICHGGLPPRWDVIGSLPGLESSNMVRLISSGVVRWPPDRKEHPAIVFERPRGARVAKSAKQRRTAFNEDQLTRMVIDPLVQAMLELRLRRVFHGAINPTNMFLQEADGNNAKVQLGECATCPVGYTQPIAFETIERGMAEPVGRGPGSMADDLYAVGVSILYFSLGYLPGGHLDDRALLDEKAEKGSFVALVGDTRLPLAVLEPVRGLLTDSVGTRWSLDDLEQWLSGRRMSPRQAHAPLRASRPFTLAGQDYWNARTLATAMGDKTLDANQAIEKGELIHWIRRSLDQEEMINRVEEAMRSARVGRGGSVEDRRVARVAIALDPAAPIRFRGRSIMPTGLGDALAEAFAKGSAFQELAEMITAQLPMFWVNSQEKFNADFVSLSTAFDRARGYLDQKEIGGGIERCLYELNPSMPLQSPLLPGTCILDLERLLWALEDLAASADRPAEPLDRHIAAFVLSRQTKLSDRLFHALSADQGSSERSLAMLGLFFELQKATRVQPLPHLCSWVASLMEPAITCYHSRTLRQRIRDTMESESKSGLLQKLHAIFSNTNLARRDAAAFRAACRDYAAAGRSIAHRQDELMNRNSVAEGVGRQTAAVVSGLLSAALMIAIVILNAS